MTLHALIGLLSGLLIAADGPQEGLLLPRQRQPWFAVARMDGGGVVTVRSKVTKYREEVRRGAGGQPFIKMVPYEDVSVSQVKGQDVQVYVTDGKGTKKVDPKRLPELLKEERPVLIAPAGEELDPFYAQVVKEGTVVIVPPRGSQGR